MSTHRLRRTETAQRLATTVSTPTPGNTTLPRPYGTHVLQSVPSTHSGPFASSKGQEYFLKGLEATLSDNKKKYGDKVNALLSAWEHVSNYIPAAPPEATQSLIEWAHRHTLTLVLRGEWPKLAPVAKTHLCVTLQKCVSHLMQHPAALRCTALLALVHNPWTHPTLDSILNGQPDSEHEEEFCCSEKGELLTMRLKILCEDRCEDIAVNLAAACVRSLRRSDQLRSLSESHHVHYMIDVYIVLLYKLKRTQDIFAQLKLMDLSDGLELVQRLSGEKPTKYGTARVWRNSIKAAELVAQYLVTAGMVRPVSETGANILEQILNSWALLHAKLKDVAPTLPGMIRKLIEPAESAQHIYIFCAVLAKHFGDSIKPLVIELYIRALTADMNELESQKAKSDKDKVRETAKRLSTQFLKLADVVDSNIGIARECVLTAFSLHPTRICYDRIKELAVACGKAKEDGSLQDTTVIEENKLKETGGEDSRLRVALKDVKNEPISNDNIEPVFSAASLPPNSMVPEVQQQSQDSAINITEKNINFQSGQLTKTFEQTNQLLKSLLTRNIDATTTTVTNNDRCLSHQKCNSNEPLGELCFNCGEFTNNQQLNVNKSQPASSDASVPTPPVDGDAGGGNHVERTLDALILIKGEAVTGSANYDETSVPNQVLDGEKLGLSPQLCDDLAVVLSSPRYHMLSWVLDWKELKGLCERYLENAEEMRNTNKELKYLNIDYSQFKDWPSEEDTKDVFFGIEKGYEQWVDPPSDNSEQFGSFQPAGGYKRSSTRRSIDDTTDSDSGSILRVRRTGRARKVLRLESSDSDCDSADRKPKHFRNRISSVSDSDSNTQDSQTDSLGSDGCRLETKKKPNKSSGKESAKKRSKSSKLTVESVSHFHMLVNEDVRHTNTHEDASGSDVSSNDIITLFSADMDENKRETIKGSTYTAAAPLIITERRSDPAVLKSLRMFRPQNSKKPPRITQLLQKNMVNKNKDNNGDLNEEQTASNIAAKFAPMLSTLNLNPKIVLTRADEGDCKQLSRTKKPSQRLSSGDITSELINIQKTMPYNKSVMTTYQKQKERTSSKSNNANGGKNDLGCPVVVDGRRDHRHHLGAVKSNLESMSSIASTNKQPTVIDSTFLVTGGPSSSDSQESSVQQSTETIDRSCKVGNGLLYGNARLQEAWEPEGKVSPDTPWRYVPTSMNALNNESLKMYTRNNSNSAVTLDRKKERENRMPIPNSRDNDTENVSSVLQIINKGHSIEMPSGQIYQSNTKKYFMNHTLEPFGNKNSMLKTQLMPRLDRELMQQRIERKTAAYERELKLQKSLSEECEDLGVDEPSTSDLFPEADLLFDTNHSPSYDHSSQDASCSQPLGMKSYNSTYFRTLDSSSGSRDDSPINDFKTNERKKNANQRARALKDSMKRSKREPDLHLAGNPTKHMRLTLDNLSQDEASNSNSDMSRLSPGNLGSLELNDSSKDTSHRIKLTSRCSKEGTPSSVSSIPSNMKLDMDMDSESLPPSINVNNTSAASSGDESLTLLSGNTADVTIPSPLSPMTTAGPLLSTHNKYTYINKKRVTSSKVRSMGYMAWESPMSERTRSSSDDEDSSISESIGSQPEDSALSNGLEDNVQALKALTADRRCTYVKKKEKLQVNARVVLNRSDHNKATVLSSTKRLPKTTAESIATATESMVMSSDKASEASEDETNNIVLSMEPDCRARRSSLRGHVKKGCACCNGSPERPKKKTTTPTVKSEHNKQKKRLLAKQPGKKR